MRVLLAAIVPALVLATTLIPVGDGPSAAAARVGAPLLAGFGLLPVAFSGSRRGGFAMALVVLAATAGGVALGSLLSSRVADVPTLMAWVLISFATIGGVVTPLLVLGYRATAASAWLLIAALLCGSVLLAKDAGGAVPQPVLDSNPLVRVLWHGLGFDWLHAANMYPRIGTLYYRYPDRSDGILAALLLGAMGAAAGGLISIWRRMRTAQA